MTFLEIKMGQFNILTFLVNIYQYSCRLLRFILRTYLLTKLIYYIVSVHMHSIIIILVAQIKEKYLYIFEKYFFLIFYYTYVYQQTYFLNTKSYVAGYYKSIFQLTHFLDLLELSITAKLYFVYFYRLEKIRIAPIATANYHTNISTFQDIFLKKIGSFSVIVVFRHHAPNF